MSDKLEVKQTIIVEGRYDRMKLKEFISSPILLTGGFRVFRDKDKQALIRKIAKSRGILILTDSDSAGFVIRNFLKGITQEGEIFNAYIPEILGKEKRKEHPSKEGKLGVEGIDRDILIDAIKRSGAQIRGYEKEDTGSEIEKSDLFIWGLTGRDESRIKREKILKLLGFPSYLSVNEMLAVINSLYSRKEFIEFLKNNGYI